MRRFVVAAGVDTRIPSLGFINDLKRVSHCQSGESDRKSAAKVYSRGWTHNKGDSLAMLAVVTRCSPFPRRDPALHTGRQALYAKKALGVVLVV